MAVQIGRIKGLACPSARLSVLNSGVVGEKNWKKSQEVYFATDSCKFSTKKTRGNWVLMISILPLNYPPKNSKNVANIFFA